jgi:PKD repeat protein
MVLLVTYTVLDGSINVLPAGSYTFEVADNYGGSQVYDFVVEEVIAVDASVIASANTVVEGSNVSFEYQGNGANTFVWTIDGNEIAQTAMFDFTFNNPGIYEVQVLATNQTCEALASHQVTVSEKVTSISEVAEGTVSIYANNGDVVLNFVNIKDASAEVAIYNLLGQELISRTIAANGKQIIKNANWANGYYIVKVKVGDSFVNQTIQLTK